MITTIKLRDLIKYLVGIITVIFVAVYSTRFFMKLNNIDEANFKSSNSTNFIKYSINIASYIEKDKNTNKREKIEVSSRKGLKRILDMELPTIKEKEKEKTNDLKKEEENDDEFPDRKETKIKETYTDTYGSVKIKNLTDIKLTKSILKPDFNVKNTKKIIIYHTHTCESYTPTKNNSYKASGTYRTTDLNYSVVKVGETLAKELEKYKFNVVQDKTKHDYPAYTGSYTRSLETIEKILDKNKNTDIVFDVHRDAVGSNKDYAPTVTINGEKVAQLMFVIGTNDGGGKHPDWKNNLKFAVKVQEKANEMYPGLFRSINLRSATFNQKVTSAASIIEVGATGNTLEEATGSMKYLANVLNAVLK